jgi:peptidoglycan/LPS O-acetylase OafA/YrhL
MAVIALTSALILDQSRERLHGLDHLRALATLLVLVFHHRAYYGTREALIPFGVNTSPRSAGPAWICFSCSAVI